MIRPTVEELLTKRVNKRKDWLGVSESFLDNYFKLFEYKELVLCCRVTRVTLFIVSKQHLNKIMFTIGNVSQY